MEASSYCSKALKPQIPLQAVPVKNSFAAGLEDLQPVLAEALEPLGAAVLLWGCQVESTQGQEALLKNSLATLVSRPSLASTEIF